MANIDFKDSLFSASSRLVMPPRPGVLTYAQLPSTLQLADFHSQAKANSLQQSNFDSFLASCEEGVVLHKALALTTSRSFLSETLRSILENAQLRNKLVEIIHGQDLVRSFEYIPWLGMLAETFSIVPNRRNDTALAEAQDTLSDFTALASKVDGFADFIKAIDATSQKSEIQENKINYQGLEIKAIANGSKVKPTLIDGESSCLEIQGVRYFNGIPEDRLKFPCLAIPQESKLEFEFKNTGDKVLMLVPTVNGIPLRIEEMAFSLCNFTNSNFPLLGIKPHPVYLAPGESIRVSDLSCNRLTLTNTDNPDKAHDYSNTISDLYSAAVDKIIPFIGKAFKRTISPEFRELLNNWETLSPEEKEYFLVIRDSSIRDYASIVLKMLNQGHQRSWRTELIIKKPVFVESSEQLSNPMLGTFGLSIMEVTPPLRKDYIPTPLNLSETVFLGTAATRSMGGAGLATIGGGDIYSGARLKNDWKHSDGVHTYKGFLPLNLISLSK